MTEKVANNAASTLSSAITSTGATTLDVTSATPFPNSGNFRILVDDELMLVTGVSGTIFTVTRGVESTTAATHSNGAAVTHILTAEGLTQLITDTAGGGGGNTIDAGPIGSRPTAGTAGNLYIPDNSLIFQRDNGVSWDSFGPLYRFVQPPAAASFTFDGAGSSTLTDQAGGLLLTAPYTNTGDRAAFYIPQTGTWEVTMAFQYVPDCHNGNAAIEVGLGFVDSVNSYYSYAAFVTVNAGSMILNTFVDSNFHNSAASNNRLNYLLFGSAVAPPLTWFRLNYDPSGNRTYSISFDGVSFVQIYSESHNSTFTPDSAGIIACPKAGDTTATNLGANLLVNIFDWH